MTADDGYTSTLDLSVPADEAFTVDVAPPRRDSYQFTIDPDDGVVQDCTAACPGEPQCCSAQTPKGGKTVCGDAEGTAVCVEFAANRLIEDAKSCKCGAVS